jgi:hypothetical protein
MHRTTNSKTNTAKTCVSSNQNTTQQITKKTPRKNRISAARPAPKNNNAAKLRGNQAIRPRSNSGFTRVRWEEGIVW